MLAEFTNSKIDLDAAPADESLYEPVKRARLGLHLVGIRPDISLAPMSCEDVRVGERLV